MAAVERMGQSRAGRGPQATASRPTGQYGSAKGHVYRSRPVVKGLGPAVRCGRRADPAPPDCPGRAPPAATPTAHGAMIWRTPKRVQRPHIGPVRHQVRGNWGGRPCRGRKATCRPSSGSERDRSAGRPVRRLSDLEVLDFRRGMCRGGTADHADVCGRTRRCGCCSRPQR